jgi:hypothetical protein
LPAFELGEAPVDDIVIPFWFTDLEPLVSSLLTQIWQDVPFKKLEVIIGSNHGQGKFGEIAKFVVCGENMEVLRKETYQIGCVDSKSDSIAIFEATIGQKLNQSIKKIVNKWAYIRDLNNSILIDFVDPTTDASGDVRT